MQLGDLVSWERQHWMAVMLDRATRTMTLLSESGTRIGVAANLDRSNRSGCVVIANPAKEWPCILHGQKRRLGRLVAIQRAQRLGAAVNNLRAFHDYVLTEPDREGGGPMFFNPALGMEVGETLLALFERGTSKIVVPTSFSTLEARAAKAMAKPKELPTVYDRLMDDEDDFGGPE